MKNKLLSVILLFVTIISYSQDLIPITSGQIMNTSISTSDLFDIKFQIQNIGSSTSAKCYTELYISPNIGISNTTDPSLIAMGFVSTEQLTAGQISSQVEYKLPLPSNIPTGNYYVYISANDNISNNQVYETNYNNNVNYLNSNTIYITQNQNTNQNIPYPILFVHGFTGDRTTWEDFADRWLNQKYGWSNGGVLDFCLNADNDVCSGGPISSEVKSFVNTSNLKIGDYYFINFDIDANGISYTNSNDPSNSNQSAIVKQGAAVHWAINYIKSITGAQKVILVGHSMGGLACREYLQSTNYNNDVAKLMECATPNSGTDAYGWGSPNVIDWQSEAIRDLKYTYDTGYSGCYLWGGNEDASKVGEPNALPSSFYFYNVDVNCDGNTNCGGFYNPPNSSYQSIIGLNYKSHPDINYSCVCGYGNSSGCNQNSSNGDGIVEQWSADLYTVSSFASTYIDTFWTLPRDYYNCLTGSGSKKFMHMDMTKDLYFDINMKALDEDDYFDLTNYGHAYDISCNTLYYGVMAEKSYDPSNSNRFDYDDYKFVLNSSSNLTLNIYNIDIHDMNAGIYSSNQTLYSPLYYTIGKGSISSSLNNVPAGTYYLEISGLPTSFSYWREYGFEILNSNGADVSEIITDSDINIYPNPSSGEFNIEIKSPSISYFNIEIINELGEVVYSENKSSDRIRRININELPNGIYAVRINNSESVVTKKIIISK